MKTQPYVWLVLLLLFSSCTTTFYLSRHAEREDQTPNSDLSDVGFMRAGILRDTLLNKGIDSIFVTDLVRTQHTAESLSLAINEIPRIYPATNQGTLDQIAALRRIGGKQVLVVGHSNTIPQIIDSLMRAPQNIVIPDNDFDNLYRVKISHGFRTTRRLTPMTYGPPSPSN